MGYCRNIGLDGRCPVPNVALEKTDMPLYNLTYEFESSGGNIEYQTRQTVEKEASINDVAVTLVTTGIALSDDCVQGTATIEVASDIVPTDVFDAAVRVEQLSPGRHLSGSQASQNVPKPASALQPEAAIQRLERSSDIQDLLTEVRDTPGRGCMFNSDLTRYRPHEQDRWFVPLESVEANATAGFTVADIVGFYHEHLDRLEAAPELKIGCFHRVTAPAIRIGLVAPRSTEREAKELVGEPGRGSAMNFYRFELSKASLVVGASTHGPGSTEAIFRSPSGDEVSSQELAYRHWREGLAVHSHPLGIMVDGDLYRPVLSGSGDQAPPPVGEPIVVDTYRGSAGKPWQFGITRYEDQLLITQARAGPEKFDPVLKRFPIQPQVIEDGPLVFSHTVNRRVWNEDPLNQHVQSQRSEGLRTQFLYSDSDGWHLIQPKSLGKPAESTDAVFKPAQLAGVSVRSSLLRSEAEGDTKATVEHAYRVTENVFDACSCLYVLSYHEANEESLDRLQWEIADATAYEIVRGDAGG